MDLFLSNLEKENPKYLRKDIDGGILTEKYEIDRYKLEQFNNVIDNLMLGNYNEFGEYILQDEIKQELIKCRKVIEDNYENILFVKTETPVNAFSYLNFAVKVLNSEKNGYKIAVLELLEPIYKAKGYIENTQATVLAKLVLPNNDIFKDEVYKAFNIVLDNEGGKRELKDEDEEFKNIIDRKIRLLYVKKHIQAQEDYMICYKKNVEELKKTEEGKKVIENYQKEEEVAKKYLNLDENDYKSKNELLTENIEKIFKTPPKPIVENIIELNGKVVKQINDIIKKIEKPIIEQIVNNKITTKRKGQLSSLIDNTKLKKEAKITSLQQPLLTSKKKKNQLNGLISQTGKNSENEENLVR